MRPSTVPSFQSSPPRGLRLEALFDELSELAGQRNAIDGRIVEIAAEMDRDGLWAATGCKSMVELIAWKIGVSPHNATSVMTVAGRSEELPRCTAALREGRLSLDQVQVIADRSGPESDAHYLHIAERMTVAQLRTAVALEPKPVPEPKPEPGPSISKSVKGEYTTYRIRVNNFEAAKVDAALASHRDGLIADWKRDHADADADRDADVGAADNADAGAQVPPFPTARDAFMSLIDTGWDADVARRPHGQHTTVIVHLDVEKSVANLHLGPVLTEDDRRYLTCDATCEVWFERHGQPIGSGRATRTISRRLRRALEHRDACCVVPGCGATRGLHAHHIRHWEDGGPTELWNLVLVCPFHHRAHHRGLIAITGTATALVVIDDEGQPLTGGSLARPPTTPPPDVAPYAGPTGERAQWKWYHPFEPPPPTTN
ncbi:HNH endonuclease signature motif containing protein [Mycolicibacterium iranicum]|uniref:HNH nuclease domain-containing protein n=1 Tax=Mycolicibacterium iranicum TaxID=912594 RepID=A0A178LR32_MYCIR|nr:HNH endonuclease signature motif containing protein [Mycolicibacterium iranicum]OAN36083.1 hypothetical protein A4X20_25595 [Mycolicibacterium iranicum]